MCLTFLFFEQYADFLDSKLIFIDRSRGLFLSLSLAYLGRRVTHPRFLDVFHLKKTCTCTPPSLPPPVFSRRGDTTSFFIFFFFYFQSSERFNRGEPTFDRANLPPFMQITIATIIDNNCRRSIAVSIASSDRIRPFASNKMHDFLSVF